MDLKNDNNPLVSVVIAAYNAADYIEETLASILSQTYTNLEIIVVDDGSTDHTAAIVKSYSPKVDYYYQKNSGSCASPRNTGLRKINGEFVTFFDADDIMLPKKIERQIHQMLKNPEAAMCVVNYCNFEGNKISEDHFSTCPLFFSNAARYVGNASTLTSEEFRRIIIEENFTIASSPLFRTSYIKAEKGFDESLTACEDFHLIYRVGMRGSVLVDKRVGFKRRLHSSNMSSDNERMLRNLIDSRSKLIENESIPDLNKRLSERVIRYKRDLQTCLVKRRKLKAATKLYLESFPPKSLSDLNHDLRQGVKIAAYGIMEAMK